jgi:hypothetical protein
MVDSNDNLNSALYSSQSPLNSEEVVSYPKHSNLSNLQLKLIISKTVKLS